MVVKRLDFTDTSIMVIQPIMVVRKLIQSIFEGFGVGDIWFVSNTEEAIKVIKTEEVDLLVTGDEDGIKGNQELIKKIREGENLATAPFVPVMAMLPESKRNAIPKYLNAGVHEVIILPLSPRKLFTRLAEIIYKPRAFVATATYFGPDRRRLQMRFKGGNKRNDGASQQGKTARSWG